MGAGAVLKSFFENESPRSDQLMPIWQRGLMQLTLNQPRVTPPQVRILISAPIWKDTQVVQGGGLLNR